MAELADVLDLGTSVAGRVGSNPTIRTSMAISKAQILPSIQESKSEVKVL